MNVPIPPVFLYEYDYSKYEVMDGLTTIWRRPILILTQDTSQGPHDTMIAVCDVHRYASLRCTWLCNDRA